MHPGFHQSHGALGGGHVAADDLAAGKVGLDPFHHVQHALGVAVGRVHHQHVHAGVHQGLDPFIRALAHAHGGADAQCLVLVLAGVGKFLGLMDVLDRDQALELEVVVHHQDLLDAVLVQQGRDLFLAGAFLDGHQLVLFGHDVPDRVVVMGLETQVAAGNDTYQLRAVHHGNPGDVVGAGQVQDLADTGVGTHRDGVADDAGLEFLHLTHLPGLLLGAHVLVDDADAALLGHGDSQARLRDGIHGGRHEGDIQPNGPGKLGFQADLPGQNAGIGGNQQDIIECEGFFCDPHFGDRQVL